MNSNRLCLLSLVVLAGANVPRLCAQAPAPESGGSRWETAADVANGRYPMDLARGSVGARIQVRAPKASSDRSDDQENRSAQALISDDASLGYPLSPGVTSLLVTLPKIEVLSRFNFISYEAGGEVSISASSVKLPFESPDWRSIAKGKPFNSQQVVGCALGSIEARYLKFDFNTQTPGRIASLGLFGLPKISNFKIQPMTFNYAAAGGEGQLQARSVFFDYANLYTGANVVAVSGGGALDQAQTMIDGNPETSYTFDPTDPAPSMVVDLGSRRSLNRVSCVYEAGAGKLDVYLADNPGAEAAGFQRVNLNYVGSPEEGAGSGAGGGSGSRRQALMSVDTSLHPGLGHSSADLSGQSGRFLIAEFHPTGKEPDFKDFKDGPRDFKDSAQDFKDRPASPLGQSASEPSRFRVLAFSAFGDGPHGQVITRLPVTPINNPAPFPPTPEGSSVSK